LDFLGNPVRFFDHMSTGVTAMYYEPFLEGLQSMASNTIGEKRVGGGILCVRERGGENK
jgi:hypothetical protein